MLVSTCPVVVVFVVVGPESTNAFPLGPSSYCGDVVLVVLPVGLAKAVLGEGCVSSREK